MTIRPTKQNRQLKIFICLLLLDFLGPFVFNQWYIGRNGFLATQNLYLDIFYRHMRQLQDEVDNFKYLFGGNLGFLGAILLLINGILAEMYFLSLKTYI